MKTTIIKSILLGASLITLIVILLGAHDSISGTLSFFNTEDITMPYGFSSQSNSEPPRSFNQTAGSTTSLYDVELHYLKRSFGRINGDTTFTLKYITLKGSRHQLNVGKDGLRSDKASRPEAINARYHQLQSLHSIPFKKLNKNFWKQFLLSNVIIKTVIYSCVMLLIFLITINAFNTTPFTFKIRNKFYLLAASIFLLVLESWIFNRILSAHLHHSDFDIPVYFNPFNTWFLMGLLTLFIATIFDFGIRLQKEQDLTI